MNIKQKIGGAIVTGTLLASLLAPMAFAADLTIDGNGTGSTNHAAAIKISKSKVKQKNKTIVGTNVTTVSNTGNNKSNNNTGGAVTTDTGKVTNTVGVDVAGGTNTNEGVNCCCDGEAAPHTIEITGNGSNSDNKALVLDICKHKVSQENTTIVGTNVTTTSNTGGNQTNGNTGGTTNTDTGDVSNTVTVNVTGSSNTN